MAKRIKVDLNKQNQSQNVIRVHQNNTTETIRTTKDEVFSREDFIKALNKASAPYQPDPKRTKTSG